MSEDKKQLARVALKQQAVAVNPEPYSCSAEALAELGRRLGVEALDLGSYSFPLSLLELIPREIAERHQLLPVECNENTLVVAMVDPTNTKSIDELSFVTGKQVRVRAVPAVDLQATLQRAYLALGRGEQLYVGPRAVVGREAREPEPEFVPVGRPSTPERSQDEIPVPELDLGGGGRSFDSTGTFRAYRPEASAASDEKTAVGDADDPEVLVVEDDAAVSELMHRLLVQLGYRVACAATGREAIELLKRHRPRLLVLDAMLPGMHGFELLRRLRASRRYSALPVIMVSAVHRGWEMAEDLRQFGVHEFIEKPFKAAQLRRSVQTALGANAGRDNGAAEEHLRAGLTAFKAGEPSRALEHLQRGLELDPDCASLHFHIGLLLGQRGDLYSAISALERAAELDGRDFACVKNLAILYQQAGFVNKAVGLWQRALRLAPDEATKTSIEDRLISLRR